MADTCVVYFQFNKTTLHQNQVTALDEWVSRQALRAFSEICISAYADSVGSEHYNLRLTAERANTIKQLLADRMDESISIHSYGEQYASTAPAAADRKATIIVKYSEKQLDQETQKTTTAIDTIITLKNIQFIEDLPYLTAEGEGVIKTYITMIKRFRFDRMEIVGYYFYDGPSLKPTDSRFKLSEQRAKVIADIFRNEGFDAARISSKGGGNSKMVIEHANTDEEKRRNIRVEVILHSTGN